MNKFKETLIYIALFAVIIACGFLAYHSFNNKSTPYPIDSVTYNSIKRVGFLEGKMESEIEAKNKAIHERDSLFNLQFKFTENNTQYKKDYVKKTPLQTDNDLIEWSKKKR